MVMAKNDQGQTIRCSGKRAVEKATIKANKNKYNKCLQTPPMQDYFVRDFGYDGNTPAADAVLAGTYVPPPEADPVMVDFLRH